MACNSVATVRAKVAQEVLDRLMEGDKAHLAIANYLGTLGKLAWHRHVEYHVWEVIVGGQMLRVALTSWGGLTVEGPPYNRDIAMVKAKLETFLPSLANLILAGEIKDKLAKRYKVNEQNAGGAVVLTFEV